MRLNKYISETGVCSRREADRWIEAGRVTINGALASLGTQVRADDAVRVDGELVAAKPAAVYIALNKPIGVICTTEADVKNNIIDHVGFPERIFPIGRLDRESEGLILLTNDGDIVNEILRSENNHEKEYVVVVDRPVTEMTLRLLADGVRIMGIMTKPSRVTRLDDRSFRIVLTQGMNRQIRRMCSALGYKARHLRRVRIMNVLLGDLRPGQWRHLSAAELVDLLPQQQASS